MPKGARKLPCAADRAANGERETITTRGRVGAGRHGARLHGACAQLRCKVWPESARPREVALAAREATVRPCVVSCRVSCACRARGAGMWSKSAEAAGVRLAHRGSVQQGALPGGGRWPAWWPVHVRGGLEPGWRGGSREPALAVGPDTRPQELSVSPRAPAAPPLGGPSGRAARWTWRAWRPLYIWVMALWLTCDQIGSYVSLVVLPRRIRLGLALVGPWVT
jgi:hypothetical protein